MGPPRFYCATPKAIRSCQLLDQPIDKGLLPVLQTLELRSIRCLGILQSLETQQISERH